MKKCGRIFGGVLFFILVCFLPLPSWADSPMKGTGTYSDPYQISTAEQFNQIRNNLKAEYKLIANIDLSQYEWVPIGTPQIPFIGTLDGNGYTISNITIKSCVEEGNGNLYQGIFGVNEGDIKNLTIKNVSLEYLETGGLCAGIIAGSNRGVIAECDVSGSIRIVNDYGICVGGISGSNSSEGKIENCINRVSFDLSNKKEFIGTERLTVGGISGSGGGIKGCTNYGEIRTDGWSFIYCGGIAGEGASLQYCINRGKITVKTTYNNGIYTSGAPAQTIGGLIGETVGKVKNCINYGDIAVQSTKEGGLNVGGIAGRKYLWNGSGLENCYNFAKNISSSNSSGIGRICGWASIQENCYSSADTLINGVKPISDIGKDKINGANIGNGDEQKDAHSIEYRVETGLQETTGKNLIDLDEQTFNFTNSTGDMGVAVGKPYPINVINWDTFLMSYDFSLTDISAIYTSALNGWGGSCFGMSSVVVQNYYGQLDIGQYQKNLFQKASVLRDLKKPANDKAVQDLIGINQYVQVGTKFYNAKKKFSSAKKTDKEKIKYLIDLLKKIDQTRQPVLIGYQWFSNTVEYKNTKGERGISGHAVIAYSLETENAPYNIDGKEYAYKICVIDPNYLYTDIRKGDSKCIYVSSDLTDCVIPEGGINSNQEYEKLCYRNDSTEIKDFLFWFLIISDDLDVIAPRGSDSINNTIIRSDVEIAKVNGKVLSGYIKDQSWVESIDYPLGDTSGNGITIYAKPGKYEFETKGNGQISYQTNDVFAQITTRGIAEMTFEKDGSVALNTSSPYTIEITSEKVSTDNDVDKIVVSGKKATDLNVSVENGKVDISGDNLKNVKVEAGDVLEQKTSSITIKEDTKKVSVNTQAGKVIADTGIKKGDTFNSGNFQYTVTKISGKSGTVSVKKCRKTSLTSAAIPDTVKKDGYTFKVNAIADKAFRSCIRLTSVTIGKNVVKIGREAFYRDSKLKKITIKGSGLKQIGTNAFKGIYKKAVFASPSKKASAYKKMLTKKTGFLSSMQWKSTDKKTWTVTFKNGNKVVKKQKVSNGKSASAPKLTRKGYVLSWNRSFKKVTKSITVKAVWTPELPKKGYTATIGSLKYKVTKSAKKNGTAQVIGTVSKMLTKIEIPQSVKIGKYRFTVSSIGKDAFKNCKKLKSMKLEKTMKTIGKRALSGTTKNLTVTVPKSDYSRLTKQLRQAGLHRQAKIKKK